MSTIIRVEFLAAKYHATPWSSQVNEGQVEWPPSPWRLLRAMLHVGFTKLDWGHSAQTIPDEAQELLSVLAENAPEFWLPSGSIAHTRHYMPDGRNKDGHPLTSRVLDAFLRFDTDAPLYICYPVALDEAQRELLAKLVGGLAYLGRAESWVQASLVEDESEMQGLDETQWAMPLQNGEMASLKQEQTALLAPLSAVQYAAFKAEHDENLPRGKNNRPPKSDLPEDVLGCLCMDTADWKEKRWSRVPGSYWLNYVRPLDCIKPSVASPTYIPQVRTPVEAMLLAVTSDTKYGDVRPPMRYFLQHTERLHQLLVAKSAHINGDVPSEITGKSNNNALQGPHQHLHFVPLDLDRDGRLDHVLLHAPMGLGADAQRAIIALKQTFGKNLPKLIVSVVGSGSLTMMRRQIRNNRGNLLAEMGTSRVWQSQTPFVFPRFLHKSGKHSMRDQILRECASRGLPQPIEIYFYPDRAKPFLRFVRKRRDNKPQPPSTRPHFVKLVFQEPIQGPLSLGYASHFGLGLFRACKD